MLFDNLLAEIENEMLAEAEAVFRPAPRQKTEEAALPFKQVMSNIPHGDVTRLVPEYSRLRAEMGRDFLALALLAGGYPPDTLPFLAGRDHRVAVAAALMTYPEEAAEWWKIARLLGKRQLFGLDAKNALEAVKATRQFTPRARRFVKNAVQEYVDVLAADKNAWESRTLVDGESLKALIEYAKASVPAELMAPLRDKKNWDSGNWPKLKTARAFSALAREGRYAEAADLLKRQKLSLLFVEGCADVSRPEIAAAALYGATPKQVLVRLNKFSRSGALKDPLTLETVCNALKKAATDPRVAPADVRRVRDLAGDSLPDFLQKLLAEIEERMREEMQKKSKVDLSLKEICLIADKSGSMEEAVTAAGQAAAYFADQGAKVKAIRFDTKAFEIVPEVDSDGKPDWRRTFKGIKANGGTSIGAALKKAAEIAPAADLWIVLTDGACNTHPYADENSPVPESGRAAVVWFGKSPSQGFTRWLRCAGAEEFEPGTRNGRLDYAALDDLIRLCLAGDRIEEWVATLPVGVVEKLLLTA